MSDSAIDHFLSEMRSHECLAQSADEFQSWLDVARNDWRNRHTINFLKAVEWVAARTDHSIVERLEKMSMLSRFEGPVVASISVLTGWKG